MKRKTKTQQGFETTDIEAVIITSCTMYLRISPKIIKKLMGCTVQCSTYLPAVDSSIQTVEKKKEA